MYHAARNALERLARRTRLGEECVTTASYRRKPALDWHNPFRCNI